MLELFLITIAVEFFVLWLFFRKSFSALQIFYLCFLINLLSWPLANLIYEIYNNWFVIEFGVFVVEFVMIILLFRARWWKAILASLVGNLATALIALVLILF